MFGRIRPGALLGAALSAFVASSIAAYSVSGDTPAVEIVVVDKNGAPVGDAVVMLTAKDGQTPWPANSAQPFKIRQVNREYVPYVSVVPRNASVAFVNDDGYGHHVYSFSRAKRFELVNPSGTETDPIVMNKAGVVPLGCNIHDDMLAYLYVSDTPLFARTGEDGRARIDGVAPGRYTARAWHPRARGKTAKTAMDVDIPSASPLRFALALKKPRKKPKPSPYKYNYYKNK